MVDGWLQPMGLPFVLLALTALLGAAAAWVLSQRLRAARGSLHRCELELATLLRKVGDLVVVTDARGQVQSMSHAFERMVDRRAASFQGSDVRLVLPQWSEAVQAGTEEPADDAPGPQRWLEVRTLRADGSEIPLRLSVQRVVQGDSAFDIGFLIDLDEFKRREDEAARVADQDPLTGLKNRRGLERELQYALDQAPHAPGMLALLYIDLDGFTAINERFGHEAGDEVLAEMARRIRACARQTDVVARLHTDVFVVLLPGLPDLAAATRVANKVLAGMTERLALNGDPAVRIGAAIGIATAGRGRMVDGSQLIAQAQEAMRRAKAGGAGRYRVALPSMACSPEVT